jgi:two-component system sensor histidine kinase VanS
VWGIVLRKKLSESLTARIFLITSFILLCAGAVTFALIAFATPSMYTSVVNSDLQQQTDALVERLEETKFEDCGPVLDDFIRSTRADVMLLNSDGEIADTGSELSMQSKYKDDNIKVSTDGSGEDGSVSSSLGVSVAEGTGNTTTVTTMQQYSIIADVTFSDRPERYSLYVTPHLEEENLAVRALIQMAPWLLLVLLVLSLLCAFIYSRYITRPIVRLSGIAKKMSELDFNWKCNEQRRDEIGTLGHSLDQMSQRLSAALEELEAANRALRAFFSAASHELKTPVTILKGQLSGMLEGIDVYQDRDKYLLRSLQVTGRMEHLIQEMLSISRMETGAATVKQESLELSALIERQLDFVKELIEQRGQRLAIQLNPEITVTGDASLLGKAIGNLLSNAILYSPDGAEIRVWCGIRQDKPAFTIENTGVHIQDDALPHLFEAFYRDEDSRNRSTGGSGLGLYLVRMILEKHHASCTIENTEDGVRAMVSFS